MIEAPGDPVERQFNEWLTRWSRWAEPEAARRSRERLRRELAAAARQLDLHSDAQELILGVGLLCWRSPRGDEVFRHLLTAPVQIAVDKQTGRVSVHLRDEAELTLEDQYFLTEQDGYVASRVEPLRGSLSEVSDPLDDQAKALLRKWASHGLETPCRFEPSWSTPEMGESHALVSLSPALVLRHRSSNRLVEFYQGIHASLSAPEGVAPLGWAQLMFPMEPAERLAWHRATRGTADTSRLLSEEPLFPLAMNDEQRLAFDKLSKDTALVIEGPPGTGKTHTIANLMSALLAEGKRVLVTSARDKALGVLFDDGMLPKPLQRLCVRLDDQRGNRGEELTRSVTALSDASAERSKEEILERVRMLADRRSELKREIALVHRRLWELVEAETTDLGEVAPGYRGRRADIAERVAGTASTHSWIGVMPDSAAPVPLNSQEAQELAQLLRSPAQNDQPLPTLRAGNPPAPDEFADLVSAAHQTLPASGVGARLAESLSALNEADFRTVSAFWEHACNALRALRLPEDNASWSSVGWQGAAALSILHGGEVSAWKHLWEATRTAAPHAQELARLTGRYLQIPALHGAKAAEAASAAEAYSRFLKAGGRPGKIKKSLEQRMAERALAECLIDGQRPSTAADFGMLATALRAVAVLSGLSNRWRRSGVKTNTPDDVSQNLEALVGREADLAHLIRFAEALEGLHRHLPDRSALHASGLWDWSALVEGFTAAPAHMKSARARRDLDSLRSRIADADHPLFREMTTAVERRDLAAYTTAFEIWKAHVHSQRLAERRSELVDRVAAVHPALAHKLATATMDDNWTSRLEALDEAWAWSAAAATVSTGSVESTTELQGELDRLEDALMKTTAELASEQAWWHCLQRMSVREASALRSFAREMKRVGRGKGRYAGRHRQGAREAMQIARDAVPAWVMPVRQVAETIEPRPDAFDVIIIDEASQLPVESAFLLWLAPQVIVVGDDKQCSPPMRVSGELEPIYERIEEYLPDVPRAFRHDLTPKSNLYELMNVRFPGGQRLTDHHRSMPEIIAWSSRMFYDGSLTPLRQYGTDRLPPLRVVDVPDGYREGRDQNVRNPPEAEKLVTELKAMIENPAYSGKTFGIISLQGGERSGHIRLIEQLLDEHLPDQALRERLKIRVGTPPDFQGDQRDVILLSMVATGTPRIQGGADFEQQRWNVAATRARDQMVLFTSTTLAQLKSDDLRASLLKHMLDTPMRETTPQHLLNVDPQTKHPEFDSFFEQRVFLKLRERGYEVVPQYPAGRNMRIDLVIVGEKGRLAVECDGRYWHGPKQVQDDLLRERILRRAGWTFWRLRESGFLLDPDTSLRSLWPLLDRIGIHPAKGR